MTQRERTKRITTIAMLSALAFALLMVCRIPIVLFLKYEPKDVIITIGGFIWGPMTAFIVSLVVSIVEMITISDTGLWGLLMNVLSTCTFACTAAVIYKKRRKMSGAVIGLLAGTVLMVAVMMLWNYLITPIYMGYPRQAVVELLLPAFLPFNVLKGGLNMALTLLLYKPVVTALRKAKLLEESQGSGAKRRFSPGILILGLVILVSCVLLALVLKGVI